MEMLSALLVLCEGKLLILMDSPHNIAVRLKAPAYWLLVKELVPTKNKIRS